MVVVFISILTLRGVQVLTPLSCSTVNEIENEFSSKYIGIQYACLLVCLFNFIQLVL